MFSQNQNYGVKLFETSTRVTVGYYGSKFLDLVLRSFSKVFVEVQLARRQ